MKPDWMLTDVEIYETLGNCTDIVKSYDLLIEAESKKLLEWLIAESTTTGYQIGSRLLKTILAQIKEATK